MSEQAATPDHQPTAPARRRRPAGRWLRPALLLLAVLVLPMKVLGQAPPAPQAPLRDKTTHHTITVGGPAGGPAGSQVLRFSATAGFIRIPQDGTPQMDVAFTAFTLDGADPRTRPVTIAINGGPGASSAWLNLGAIGPWRVPFGGDTLSPSAPPVPVDNAETWLLSTDLVFLDPPGTGWSRALTDEARRRAWSVNGDIAVLAEVMRRWLEANHRLSSPKLVLGESYGGFRGPRLVRALQADQGVGVAGLVLVSPLLDFGHPSGQTDPLGFVVRLPSMVATVRGATDRAALADVEAYATGDLLRDLWRGLSDAEAVGRVSTEVSRLLPGFDPALIRLRAGRLDIDTFLRERLRSQNRVGSIYDPSITGADPYPELADTDAPEPILEPMRAVLTSAVYDLYARRLEWLPDGKYEVLSNAVNRQWDWNRGRTAAESVSALRQALALDPRLRVMVAHGVADLITPYFSSKLILDQLPPLGPPGRVQLRVYGGGHMFYSADGSRAAFARDGAALVRAVAPDDAGGPGDGAAAAGTAPPAPPPDPSPRTPAPPAAR